MKKTAALILVIVLLMGMTSSLAEANFTGNAEIAFSAIRWNLNLPKTSNLIRADEYQYKFSKEITLHALLIQVTTTETMEAYYGKASQIIAIDLDTGDMIDYSNFDGNVMWPEDGEIPSKDDLMNLLFNCYCSYLEGYNELIMGEHEFITPMEAEVVSDINAALNEVFVH